MTLASTSGNQNEGQTKTVEEVVAVKSCSLRRLRKLVHLWAERSGEKGMACTGNEPGNITAGTKRIKKECCKQLCANKSDNLDNLWKTQATEAQMEKKKKDDSNSPLSTKEIEFLV